MSSTVFSSPHNPPILRYHQVRTSAGTVHHSVVVDVDIAVNRDLEDPVLLPRRVQQNGQADGVPPAGLKPPRPSPERHACHASRRGRFRE